MYRIRHRTNKGISEYEVDRKVLGIWMSIRNEGEHEGTNKVFWSLEEAELFIKRDKHLRSRPEAGSWEIIKYID